MKEIVKNNFVLSKLNEMKQAGHNVGGPLCFGYETREFLRREYSDSLIACADIFETSADDIRVIFENIKRGVTKCRYVFGVIDMLPDGNFPKDIVFVDEEFSKAEKRIKSILKESSVRQIIANVDMEKIEGLEFIYKALKRLESVRDKLSIEAFIWLEHHIQRLKILFIAVRQMTEIYLICRFTQEGILKYSQPTFRAKCNDLRVTIRNNRIVLDEFDVCALASFVDYAEELIANL